jgi:hypothetical protein
MRSYRVCKKHAKTSSVSIAFFHSYAFFHLHDFVSTLSDLGLPAAEMSRLWAAVGAASKWAAEDGLGAAAVPAQLREQVPFVFYVSLFCEPR